MYFIILLFLGYCENKLYKTGITPLNAFIFPTLILLKVVNLLESRLNFKEYESILFFIGIIWFLIGISLRTLFLFTLRKQNRIKVENMPFFLKKSHIIIFISLLFSIILAAQKYGLANIKGKLSGIGAHIFVIMSPFYLLTLYKKKSNIDRVFNILLIPLIFLLPKYQIFLLFLPFILYKLYKKRIFFRVRNIFIVFFIFFVIIVVFFLTYYINFKIKGINLTLRDFLLFIFNHTKYYLFSPLYIGEYLLKREMVGNPEIAFAPFINLIKRIKGDYIYINPILEFVNNLEVTSNVGGIIPELIYTIGKKGMYVYITILGLISYFIENLLLKDERWIFSNLVLKTSLILCFFSNVFVLLGFVERIIGSLGVTIFFIIYQNLKNKKIFFGE